MYYKSVINGYISTIANDISVIGNALYNRYKLGGIDETRNKNLEILSIGKDLLSKHIALNDQPTFCYKITVLDASLPSDITITTEGSTTLPIINNHTGYSTDLTKQQVADHLNRQFNNINEMGHTPRMYSILIDTSIYLYSSNPSFTSAATVTIEDGEALSATNYLDNTADLINSLNNNGSIDSLIPNILDITHEFKDRQYKENNSVYSEQEVQLRSNTVTTNTSTPTATTSGHTQNTDSYLAKGTVNQVSASETRTHLDNTDIHNSTSTITTLINSLIATAVGDIELNDLTDVNTTSVANGQLLQYNANAGEWQPVTFSSGVSDLADLGDVDLTGVGTDSFLKYDGTEWKVFSVVNPTLVTPTIYGNVSGSDIWEVFETDGSTPLSLLSGALTDQSITVDTGAKVEASAYFKYPVVSAGYKAPDSVSGNFGTTDPGENTNSATKTHTDLEGSVITSTTETTKSYSVTLTGAKQGLQVSGANVVVASGNDTQSDTISVVFRNRIYFGYSTNAILIESEIKALATVRFGDNTETFTGVTATAGNYTYFCYDDSYSDLTSCIMDGTAQVIGAFTKLSDVVITNTAGISKTYTIYRSNAVGAFTSNTLVFS